MSRHTIVTEGDTWPSGIYISSGSIIWDDKPIALCTGTLNGRDVTPSIGKITDIRREDNKITAEIALFYTNQEIDEEIMSFSAYISGIEFEDDDRKIVTKAKIRGVTILAANPGNPIMRPNDSN